MINNLIGIAAGTILTMMLIVTHVSLYRFGYRCGENKMMDRFDDRVNSLEKQQNQIYLHLNHEESVKPTLN